VRLIAPGGGALAAARSNGRGEPLGVELIDSAARTRRTLDPSAGAATFSRGVLFAFNGGERGARGGVRAYRRDGRGRYRILRRERIWNVQAAGRYAWAIGTNGITAFDIASGQVVSRSAAVARDEIEPLAP
jgi:hypothetical protein